MIEAPSPDCLASLSLLSLPPSLPPFLPCSPGFSGLCFANCCPIELNPNSLSILLGTFTFSPLPSFHLHHLLTSCLLYLFPSSILKAISFLQADYDLPLDCTHAFHLEDFSQAYSASETLHSVPSLCGPTIQLKNPLRSV